MSRLCKSCARPLKDSHVMKGGQPTKVQVCKSPICKKYNKPQ